MQSKISLIRKTVAISVVGIALSSLLVVVATHAQHSDSHRVSKDPVAASAVDHRVATAQQIPGLPVRLKIPSINVNAVIESVGITAGGAVGVPTGPARAAWFNLGPRPGEAGSAVIDGHYGWKDSIPAVFDDINTLRSGDKVYVQDAEGETTTFVVREIRSFGQNEDSADVFASTDGKAHLNLITCEGVWNATQKSYSDRLVVFTDREYE